MDSISTGGLSGTMQIPNPNGLPITLEVVLNTKYIGQVTFNPVNGKYILNIDKNDTGIHSITGEKITEASSSVQTTADKVAEAITEVSLPEERENKLTDEEIMKIISNNFFPYVSGLELQAIKDRANKIEEERNNSTFKSSCYTRKLENDKWFNNKNPESLLISAALQYMILTGKIHKYIIAGGVYCLCFDQRNIELAHTVFTRECYDRQTILQLSQNMNDNMLKAPADTPEDLKPFVDEILQTLNTKFYHRINSFGSKMYQVTPLKIGEVSFISNPELPAGAENKALNFLLGKGFFHGWIRLKEFGFSERHEITVRFDPQVKNYNIDDNDKRWNKLEK